MYLEVGNIEDINNMSLNEFNGIIQFTNRRKNIHDGKPVKLKQSQKDMIKRAKEMK